MNAVEIEEAISALAEQPFDAAEFGFTSLQQRRLPVRQLCHQRLADERPWLCGHRSGIAGADRYRSLAAAGGSA
jgi:hypothetical protein